MSETNADQKRRRATEKDARDLSEATDSHAGKKERRRYGNKGKRRNDTPSKLHEAGLGWRIEQIERHPDGTITAYCNEQLISLDPETADQGALSEVLAFFQSKRKLQESAQLKQKAHQVAEQEIAAKRVDRQQNQRPPVTMYLGLLIARLLWLLSYPVKRMLGRKISGFPTLRELQTLSIDEENAIRERHIQQMEQTLQNLQSPEVVALERIGAEIRARFSDGKTMLSTNDIPIIKKNLSGIQRAIAKAPKENDVAEPDYPENDGALERGERQEELKMEQKSDVSPSLPEEAPEENMPEMENAPSPSPAAENSDIEIPEDELNTVYVEDGLMEYPEVPYEALVEEESGASGGTVEKEEDLATETPIVAPEQEGDPELEMQSQSAGLEIAIEPEEIQALSAQEQVHPASSAIGTSFGTQSDDWEWIDTDADDGEIIDVEEVDVPAKEITIYQMENEDDVTFLPPAINGHESMPLLLPVNERKLLQHVIGNEKIASLKLGMPKDSFPSIRAVVTMDNQLIPWEWVVKEYMKRHSPALNESLPEPVTSDKQEASDPDAPVETWENPLAAKPLVPEIPDGVNPKEYNWWDRFFEGAENIQPQEITPENQKKLNELKDKLGGSGMSFDVLADQKRLAVGFDLAGDESSIESRIRESFREITGGRSPKVVRIAPDQLDERAIAGQFVVIENPDGMRKGAYIVDLDQIDTERVARGMQELKSKLSLDDKALNEPDEMRAMQI